MKRSFAVVLAAAVIACTQYNSGSYENSGRQPPARVVIGPVCSQGQPYGGTCNFDFDCCSAHCIFDPYLTTGGTAGVCVDCETDFDCTNDPNFPVCDQNQFQCVASGTGPTCTPESGSCALTSCCLGLTCDATNTCVKPTVDAGGGG